MLPRSPRQKPQKVQVASAVKAPQLALITFLKPLLTNIIFQCVYVLDKSLSTLSGNAANSSRSFAFKTLLHFNISSLT